MHDIYKGENIIASELQGEPSITGFDPQDSDAPYLWQYDEILPDTAYAIAQVAHCPNAVLFNPKRIAFTDTATIFIPKKAAETVPFDLLLLSDIYVWFYALATRMGVLRTCRSHIYPTNFAMLPWSDELIQRAPLIEALRERIVRACRDAADASSALQALPHDIFEQLTGSFAVDRVSVQNGHGRSADGPGLQYGTSFFSDRNDRFELLPDNCKRVYFSPLPRALPRARVRKIDRGGDGHAGRTIDLL